MVNTSTVNISSKQRRHLRGLAHDRQVIVSVGQSGITPAVLAEIDLALKHHELIKVKLPAIERDERKSVAQTLATESNADLVQTIGRVSVLFRPNETTNITLPT